MSDNRTRLVRSPFLKSAKDGTIFAYDAVLAKRADMEACWDPPKVAVFTPMEPARPQFSARPRTGETVQLEAKVPVVEDAEPDEDSVVGDEALQPETMSDPVEGTPQAFEAIKAARKTGRTARVRAPTSADTLEPDSF
jgi:hypothetical protein